MYRFKEGLMKVPAFIYSQKGNIEDGAIKQVKNMSSLPFTYHHTVLNADGHQGYGMPIGGVLATKDIIIPNAVGVDIGCGMCAVKTSLTNIDTETLKKIIEEIKKVIPVGFHKHTKEQKLPAEYCFNAIRMRNDDSPLAEEDIEYYKIRYPICFGEYDKSLKSLGTLGGGNHFIEIQKGDDGFIWIMIHSGSRNLGLKVANYYNKLAVELNTKWYSQVPKEYELAFLPIDSEEGQSYIREMNYCINYAFTNRKLMMDKVKQIFRKVYKMPIKGKKNKIDIKFDSTINIAHNYAQLENHFEKNVMIHRKGATLARKDTIGIIPGSQGTKSYIVQGKGNPESFMSCSHGAGRIMSRTKAQANLNLEDEIKKLDDIGVIHSIKGKKDLDEAPSAYKDISEVMENQKDLVDILVELTPLAVIKG